MALTGELREQVKRRVAELYQRYDCPLDATYDECPGGPYGDMNREFAEIPGTEDDKSELLLELIAEQQNA